MATKKSYKTKSKTKNKYSKTKSKSTKPKSTKPKSTKLKSTKSKSTKSKSTKDKIYKSKVNKPKPIPKTYAPKGSNSPSFKLSTKYGASKKKFGHKDYYAARDQGKTDKQIRNYLKRNPTLLGSGNARGKKKGLYEQIVSGRANKLYLGIKQPKPTKPVDPKLTVDPQITSLQDQVSKSQDTIKGLTNQLNTATQAYDTSIDTLQGQIEGYADQISNYQSQIGRLDERLIESARAANQLKKTDTEYLTGNRARGIRLRRSRKAQLGINTLGTSSLNRKNRQSLQIGNVNL